MTVMTKLAAALIAGAAFALARPGGDLQHGEFDDLYGLPSRHPGRPWRQRADHRDERVQ